MQSTAELWTPGLSKIYFFFFSFLFDLHLSPKRIHDRSGAVRLPAVRVSA